MSDSNPAQEVAKQEPRLSADQLRNIQNFDDALRLLQEEVGAVVYDASTEIGDGFDLLENKDRLIDVPFIAVAWMFADGDFGTNPDGTPAQFLVMRVVTGDGHKWIVTDGSTGICQQVRDFQMRTGAQGGLVVKGGLRRSDYKTQIPNPKTGEMEEKPASTYYLNV